MERARAGTTGPGADEPWGGGGLGVAHKRKGPDLEPTSLACELGGAPSLHQRTHGLHFGVTRSDVLPLVHVRTEHRRVATASLRRNSDRRMRTDVGDGDVLTGLSGFQSIVVQAVGPVEHSSEAPVQRRAGR